MREIKFRGFCEHENGKIVISVNGEKHKGTWVYGVPIKTKIGIFIIDEENPHYCSQYQYMEIQMPKLVIPETVGQFTGLHDKNGKEIFEGDILLGINSGDKYKVIFKDGCFLVSNTTHPVANLSVIRDSGRCFKIIGNIHDKEEINND